MSVGDLTEATLLGRALGVATEVALEVGAQLWAEFSRPGGARGSDPNTADADRRVERIIRERLLGAFPGWGFLGEETGEAAPAKAGPVRTWIVDPNDGTSAFLRGWRGASVGIAGLRDGVPVLGVSFAYASPDGEGDLVTWAEGSPLRRNGEVVARAPLAPALGPYDVVAISQAADSAAADNAAMVAPARYEATPSLIHRLARLAVGEVVGAVSIAGPHSWDYAAGHALVRAVGGELVDEAGRPITYAPNGRGRVQRCFAGHPDVARALAARPWGRLRTRGFQPAPFDLVALLPGGCERDSEVLGRAHGCLLGQLAGDALGSLVEFRSAAWIAEHHGEGPEQLVDGGTWDTIAGQPTDDSELAMALGRSIIRCGGYDPDDAARAYAWWFGTDPHDIGGTTAQALAAIDPGAASPAALARAAASRTSQANGSLMRASPLAIWGARLEPGVLARHAADDSTLTHPHEVCQSACAAFTVAVAHAIRTGAGPREVHAVAFAHASGAAQDIIGAAATAPPERCDGAHKGWVLIALRNAFYELLHAPTLEAGIVQTVHRGGDTDTNACIAGALLGAVHGRGAVPAEWRRRVLSCRPVRPTRLGTPEVRVVHPRPRGLWPVDALRLAERLLVA